MIIVMHFGDGTFKEIEVTSDDPDEAVREAKVFVNDNAWFETTDPETDEVTAKLTMF